MKRRIFAWVLLAGFVLLLLNLIVFRIYWQLSMVVYIIIAFAFLFTNGRLAKGQDRNNYNSGADDDPERNGVTKSSDDPVSDDNPEDNGCS